MFESLINLFERHCTQTAGPTFAKNHSYLCNNSYVIRWKWWWIVRYEYNKVFYRHNYSSSHGRWSSCTIFTLSKLGELKKIGVWAAEAPQGKEKISSQSQVIIISTRFIQTIWQHTTSNVILVIQANGNIHSRWRPSLISWCKTPLSLKLRSIPVYQTNRKNSKSSFDMELKWLRAPH